MRILHIITRFNKGGTATWLKILIEEQAKLGHQVFLMAGHVQNDESEDDFFTNFKGIRIESFGRRVNLFSDFLSFFFIRKKIREIQPDLINTHTSKAGLIGRLAAKSFFDNKFTLIHTYHGHILYGYFKPFLVKLIIILERLLAHITDLFLVSGSLVSEDLLSVGIGDKNQHYIIRPGIRINSQKMRFKKHDRITIGWLGRLAEIKRPDRVLKLARELENADFLIGGEGPLKEFIKLEATKNVHILGWVDPFEFWSKCDIALLTSDNEAQPISLIESQLCGIPAVAENVGSVSEVVLDGKTGFLVSGNRDRLNALAILISDSRLREVQGSMAKSTANNKFGVQQFILNHEKAYKIAIDLHKR